MMIQGVAVLHPVDVLAGSAFDYSHPTNTAAAFFCATERMLLSCVLVAAVRCGTINTVVTLCFPRVGKLAPATILLLM